ncbi:MAG: septal ring lytic transglycosylase RlpA family protein [Terracidiphilus sp.]
MNVKHPLTLWLGLGAGYAAVAAALLTFFLPTVRANVQLARPAATRPPTAPEGSFLPARPNAAAEALLPADALRGIATWYGSVLNGHHTASGERFDMNEMTAAHKTLPFGSVVRVVSLKTHRAVIVRINDRGELPEGHVIDLSYAAAKALNIIKPGITTVKLELISLGHPHRSDN